MRKAQGKKAKFAPQPTSPRRKTALSGHSGFDTARVLQTILEQTHYLIAYLDPQFNFILVNRAYAKADKRNPSFFPGKNHFDLYPNVENERIFKKVVKTGKPYFAHAKAFIYAEHPERGISYWDWSLIPDMDEKGRVIGLVLSLSDVTSRIEIEKERFRLFRAVEQSPVTVVITDPEGNIEYVNPKFAQLTGYTREEALGKKPSLLKSGVHPPEFYEALWRTIKRGKEWRGEFCNRKKNGDLYWESALISPIKDDKESITHIIGIKEDITQRKKTEEELSRYKDTLEVLVKSRTAELKKKIEEQRRTEKKLREAELQYRTVADFTHDWEYWKAPDGAFRYISPAVERITGFKAEEFIKNPDLFMKVLHPEDRPIWDSHDSYVHKMRSHGEVQFRIRNREKKVRWIGHVCHPVVDKNGRYLGLRASNRDITEQRDAEEEARRHLRELSHMSRLITVGEFTAALAHQLNQPLAAILSNAQAGKRFLASESVNVEEIKDILSAVVAEALRASDVIKGLRNLLKREDAPMTPVDVVDIIHESASLMMSEAGAKDVAMKLDLNSGLPPVLGNRIQLQEVLLNLMSNGIEAVLPKDSGQRQIIIRLRKQAGKTIRVDVQDSGIGIGEDKLEKVFEPFYTTKSWGMGMGLAINKKIIENHGGKIWAANAGVGGAIVSFSLPTI